MLFHRARGDGREARSRATAALLALHFSLFASCADADVSPQPPAAAAVFAIDDTGREVRLPRPARRLVSLLPAGTETLFALGAGESVVGRTRYDVDPRFAHLPSVGGGLDPSLEALVALRPDLVLAWESPTGSRVRTRLEEMGIPVFALATRDTADIFQTIHNLGRLTGRGAAADSLAAGVRARLAAVRAAVPPGPRPTVLYPVSFDPPMLAGTDNFIAELIGLAGGEPVRISAELEGASPQVSLEEIVRRAPDVVVVPVGEDPGLTLERIRAEPGWRELEAVREGRVVAVPSELFSSPGPRIGEMAEVMREALASVWPPR